MTTIDDKLNYIIENGTGGSGGKAKIIDMHGGNINKSYTMEKDCTIYLQIAGEFASGPYVSLSKGQINWAKAEKSGYTSVYLGMAEVEAGTVLAVSGSGSAQLIGFLCVAI